ncbi:Uncharacterised protein [Vibrio cholerae]|nr:Uncharacterised protein [Vibrio cholerae]
MRYGSAAYVALMVDSKHSPNDHYLYLRDQPDHHYKSAVFHHLSRVDKRKRVAHLAG